MRRFLRRGESGQSLVEFALVLPMLLLVLFAIIDFARLYQGHVTLTNAVREGARLGAVGGTSGEVQARVTTTAAGLAPTVSATVPTTSGQSVVVNATATVQLITPVGAMMNFVAHRTMNNNFVLSAGADMRLE